MKVIVGIDFSDHSRRALEAATQLARDLDAGLVLVHALPRPGLGAPREGRMDPITAVQQESTLHDAMEMSETWARGPRAKGLEAEVVAEEGGAADLVLRVARDMKAALVVVGTHGRSGLKRVVLGSVAEAIVRGSKVPVVVVP